MIRLGRVVDLSGRPIGERTADSEAARVVMLRTLMRASRGRNLLCAAIAAAALLIAPAVARAQDRAKAKPETKRVQTVGEWAFKRLNTIARKVGSSARSIWLMRWSKRKLLAGRARSRTG